jgi:hypothetical protein
MAIYFNVETKEYPRYAGDLKLLGWVEGEELPKNWVEVNYVEPVMEEFTIMAETLPTLIDGEWTTNWTSRKLSNEEITQLKENRVEQENKRLKELNQPIKVGL